MKKLKLFFAGFVLAFTSLGAHALDLTNFAENKIVDALVRGQALGAPATWYIALDTVACTEAGGGTEVTGGSYVRAALASSLTNWSGTQGAGTTLASTGTGGTTSNNVVVTFATPAAAWGTVVSIRWMDALTGGNAWVCTPLTLSKTINQTDLVSFPVNTLSLQVDN